MSTSSQRAEVFWRSQNQPENVHLCVTFVAKKVWCTNEGGCEM